jgi:tRNA A-37 threonylcarbamoyl transferase component Bud32
MQSLAGKSLGRYHLVEPLGEGGMALVYKAYDATLERSVAIKVIRTERGGDEAFLHRFRREAKALAQLDHPYILKILDYGEQDGMPYLVMPFLPGGTLKERMGKPLGYMEAARSLAPVARALAFAHQQGIVHRDVKPANILITQSGAFTLSDFGIAKLLEGGESNQLTATGMGIGTPDYMAPEQWLGKSGPQSDVYALGIVFFELITGRRPYTADTPAAVLLKHMYDPLPRPRDFAPTLPESVEGVIFKALAKDPAHRFADMAQFAAALERLAAGLEPQVTVIAAPGDAVTYDALAPARPGQSDQTEFAPARGDTRTIVTSGPTAPARPAARRINLLWLVLGGGAALVIFGLAAGALLLALGVFSLPVGPPTQVAAGALDAEGIAETAASTPPGSAGEAEAVETPQAEAKPTSTPQPIPTMKIVLPPTSLPPITHIQGLPEDIPIFVDNYGDLMHQVMEGTEMFMYTTGADLESVDQFFSDGMKRMGWRRSGYTTYQAQQVISYMFTKEDGVRVVQVNLVHSDDPYSTMIQVMLVHEEE